MEKNFQWWLVKIDRVAAWTLLLVMILFFISGYGITKEIINRQFAANLHSNILAPVGIVVFFIHTFLAIRMALMRWRKWNPVSRASLAVIYLGFIVFFAYTGFFYQQPAPTKPTNETATQNDSLQTGGTPTQKIFTVEELAKYDGKNGNPAYVAVDGIVYDMSSVFENDIHYGHAAGQDLTGAFFAKHIKSQIAKYPAIGAIKTK